MHGKVAYLSKGAGLDSIASPVFVCDFRPVSFLWIIFFVYERKMINPNLTHRLIKNYK